MTAPTASWNVEHVLVELAQADLVNLAILLHPAHRDLIGVLGELVHCQ